MHKRLVHVSLTILALIAALAGCAAPAAPSPTPSRGPSTPMPTGAPTKTPSPAPSPTPSPVPSLTPTAEPLSDETIALYAAGPREQPRLFALSGDGSTARLEQAVYSKAVVSKDGRWMATPSDELPADAVVISNLKTGTTYTVQVTSDYDPYGMTFDSDAARLAILEVGPPEAERSAWALFVVSLDDGSTTRFEASMGQDDQLLPGLPVGWSGDDLLINTFVPFTDEGSAGLWAITLPPGLTSTSVEALERLQLLPGEGYLFQPQLSPGGGRLLYLNRDYDYTPDNYAPVGYDLAVNQLGLLDLDGDASKLLVEETEGGALGGDVAWSPDGSLSLFAEGRYGDGTFASLTLKTVDDSGTVTDVAPVPLPPEGFLVSLDWCVEDEVLTVVSTDDGAHELHAIDMVSGASTLVASDDYVGVLGCGHRAETGMAGNADVLQVRAVKTAGAAPGEGPTTWTFHVTVEHPDTGWEDYADGWDVVTPDGQVLKPDPGDAFTRTLLHPHVDEQPFTRSQSGIVVPKGVTEVRVQAHDIVDGYGGKGVVVNLMESSGPGFEVER